MVIDMHVHPILFGPICEDKKKVEFRKQEFGLYKSSPIPMSQVMAVMDHAGSEQGGAAGRGLFDGDGTANYQQ